jgi:hypothetical protein
LTVNGREPAKNAYYSPRVIWFLSILVAIAILVVGLTICSDEDLYNERQPVSQGHPAAEDSLAFNSIPSNIANGYYAEE